MPVHKDSFLKIPSKFESQFGGWCAFAKEDFNEKVSVNSETFKIRNGELYLFYNAFFNNTLKSWNKNEAGLMMKADANCNKTVNKKIEIMKPSLFFWLLRLTVAVILVQTLYFKFTGSEESVSVFSAVGIEPYGRIGT